MQQPKGFICKGEEHLVCQLKSIYTCRVYAISSLLEHNPRQRLKYSGLVQFMYIC